MGGSGRWLKVLYGKAGCKEADNSVINVIQCQPENNIFPTDSLARSYISDSDAHTAVEHCIKNHVVPFLKSRPWKRVDTFGDKPLKHILEKSGGVSNWRGSILPVPVLGPAPLAVPTFHPAYIARDQSMIPVAINDLRKTLEIEPERYEIYPTIDQLKRFTFRRFAFDIECNRWTHEISMVGLSASPFEAIVVPFSGDYIPELQRIFANATEVIGQNCFSRDTSVLMGDGRYKPIWRIRPGELVRTADDKGRVVTRPVDSTFRTLDDRPWVSVKIDGAYNRGVGRWGNAGVVCTPDHEWITPLGRLRADKLVAGTPVYLPRNGSDSLIQGTLLGDGHCSKRGYLSLSHTNKSWTELKAKHLNTSISERISYDGYAGDGGSLVCSLSTRVAKYWRTRMYDAAGVKRWEAPVDDAALAVWYCDDGCLTKHDSATIALNCFIGQHEGVLAWARNTFGASSVWSNSSLHIHKVPSREFFKRIAPFVPPCMYYKLPLEFQGQYNDWLSGQVPQIGYVESVTPVERKKSRGKYCLTVRDTHTFFTRGGLVANCVQFDLPILASQGVTIRGPKECTVWDIMLMHHLRFPVFPHDLEFIGKQFTNKGAWKADKAIYEVYCARDVDVTFRCFGPLKELLEQAKLLDIYKYVSWPLGLICHEMTTAGVTLNGSRLKELRADYLAKIAALERDLPDELKPFEVTKRKRIPAPEGTVGKSGKPIKFVHEDYQEVVTPWRSAAVKKKYLYQTLKLPVQRHIKSKEVTVDKGALDKLYTRTRHPVLKVLKELNKYATLLSGFLKEELEQGPSEVHASFNPHGTSTGRLSSSNPNMQNQAIKTRFMYVSRWKGGKLVDGDFSGIENRITAYLANDKARLSWLADPKYSEHKRLVASFFKIPYDEVEKSHDPASPYAICKRICHGTNYCMGARKIAETYDLDFVTVRDLQAAWKREIQGTTDWQRRVMNEAVRIGYVENRFGRKLWIWTEGSGPQAVAFHPQSNAAEIMIRAMIGLYYERINWPLEWAQRVCPVVCPIPRPALLVASVHDELLCDSPKELAHSVLEAMTKVMTQPWRELGNMSLPISIGIEDSWGDFE